MAKFQNKKTKGICEVFSLDNIEKLRKSPNYNELNEKDVKKNESSKIKKENGSGGNENAILNN